MKRAFLGCLVVIGCLFNVSIGRTRIPLPTQTFTFDTSALAGYAGPFQLDFQLLDGSGTGGGNTRLTLDNFRIDGSRTLSGNM